MEKLLTIAIPTFNRAELLDRQLTWLASAIKGCESDCEIFISDNCSTDHTQEIVNKWQSILSDIPFRYHKNPENVGVMKNIVCCLQAATSKYVWTVGDDDPIQERTLSYVLTKLKQYPELALTYLNCSGREKRTGEIVVQQWFDSDSDEPMIDGKTTFQRCIKEHFGGVIFLSAAIYKTELVQRAIQTWPSASNNWAGMAYWAGFCAAHGALIVTKDTYLECTMGASLLDQETTWNFRMRYFFIPEIYLKLLEVGYSPKFCRQMILQNLRTRSGWKIVLGAFRRWPIFSVKAIIPYLRLVGASPWGGVN